MRVNGKIAYCTVFLVVLTSLMATVDRQPADLKSVLPHAAANPTTVFSEDFSDGTATQVPPGWTSNNGGNLRFYVLDGYYEFTTKCVLLNDDLAGSYTYGYRNFTSSVINGTMEFEFEIENTSAYGSAVKEYHIILRDATGSTNIINWSLTYVDATQVINASLQGTKGPKGYSARCIYKVKIIFDNNLLDMYIDDVLELSGISYGGQTIQQIYMETTSANYGGFILIDNIVVSTSTLDVYQNGQQFSLNPGAHQVSVLDSNDSSILMEFSINVLTTMQIKVTVSTQNPTTTPLTNALRFFTINVLSGTYAEFVPVKFHYNTASLTDAQENALNMFYLSPTQWNNVGGKIYKSENCVFLTLNHFSTYAVAWMDGGFPFTDVLVWVIIAGAGVIIIVAIFKFRSKKGGSSAPANAFEDLFDTFD